MSAITLANVEALVPCIAGDARGLTLLTAATQWAEQYCGRKFDRATVADERSRTVRDDAPGEARHYLLVARPPVTGVTSLYLDESITAATLYEVVQDGGRAERLFIKTYDDIPGYASRITYEGGWADGAAPSGIVLAVATLMNRMADRLLQGAKSNESSGGEALGYLSEGQFFADVRTLLHPFKLWRA